MTRESGSRQSCLFEYLSLEEFAQWMRCSKKTIQNKLSLISAGIAAENELPKFVKIAGKVVFPVVHCNDWSKQLVQSNFVDSTFDRQQPRRGRKRKFH